MQPEWNAVSTISILFQILQHFVLKSCHIRFLIMKIIWNSERKLSMHAFFIQNILAKPFWKFEMSSVEYKKKLDRT